MGTTTRARPIEVRVYRFGLLKACEWCETGGDAARIVEVWAPVEGVRCEIEGRAE